MPEQAALSEQRKTIAAFAASLRDDVQPVSIFETHISWVLVAGSVAYKLKKAVCFDFADLSTLARRRFYCEEELRLNARTAPELYLAVVPIFGSTERATLAGTGEPIEYAVKMRAFPQEALWTWRLKHGVLAGTEIDAFADGLADFHSKAAVASASSRWCTPEALEAIADETLAAIAQLASSARQQATANDLLAWERAQRARLAQDFVARKFAGCIRECHGDLHSANILTLGSKVEAFDCIDFNESLRWIDVMNDLAFACMDLRFNGRGDLAARLLNHYLERTGDYSGMMVLRYYETHRALIRCKVALLRATQCVPDSPEAAVAKQQAANYLSFAETRSRETRPALLITHGFSGSGKSTIARRLVEMLDAVQLRSDVERKRMHGIPADANAGARLYAADMTVSTYKRLQALATQMMRAGALVIVDATFLKRAQRESFRVLAESLGVPFFILDIIASEATMRERIAFRHQSQRDASDASVEILERQLMDHDPLASDEYPHVLSIDVESSADMEAVAKRLYDLLH